MEITYSVSKAELDALYKYLKQEKLDPCIDCSDKRVCCGCPRQNSYREHLGLYAKELPDGILDCKPIVDYVRTWLAADELEREIKRLEIDLGTARAKEKSFKAKIIITER